MQVFQIKAPPGCYYPPTLITGVGTTARCVVEEIFGPVLVAMPFRWDVKSGFVTTPGYAAVLYCMPLMIMLCLLQIITCLF